MRRVVEGLLATIEFMQWTSTCAEAYGPLCTHLEAQGRPLGPLDLPIASHALAIGTSLVSADRAFAMVPSLKRVDWNATGVSVASTRSVRPITRPTQETIEPDVKQDDVAARCRVRQRKRKIS